MAHHRIANKSTELQELRSFGRSWGMATGLAPLDEIYSIKKGYPLFIAGSPASGKTEIVMEKMLNTMVFYKAYWVAYFGEGGEIEDIFADLCHKLVGKPYKSGDNYSMTEGERGHAEQWINEYIILIDDEKDMTLTDFYAEVDKIERERGIKVFGTVFDPVNDLVDETAKFGGRDDKWLAHELKLVRRHSKKKNCIDILVTHISDIQPVTEKSTGKRYIPVALPSEWAGGRTWWRRAFVMFLIYRPPSWLPDETGREYGENVTLIYTQKAKPKGVAKIGVARLEWDWQRNKYFWYDNGQATFAYDINQDKHEPKKLTQAQKEFFPDERTESKKPNPDEPPF